MTNSGHKLEITAHDLFNICYKKKLISSRTLAISADQR